MRITTRDLQARLAALNFDPGQIDNERGPRTNAAWEEVRQVRCISREEDLFHPSGLHRIIWHWTAGSAGVLDLERRHYHLIVGQDERVYMGDHLPEANADITPGRYAAHTRALNSGSIGVAFDAMAGAVERPWSAGATPITEGMVEVMVQEIADLAETYDIPVSRYTILSHAEVQQTLGVRQRAKWDTAWLPGFDGPVDPLLVGTRMRERIAEAVAGPPIGRV